MTGADRKCVVSATLANPEWDNTTVLGAYSAQAIRSLKDSIDGGIYISASGTLVRALLADELVDELHLFLYQLALGAGPKLFDGGLEVKLTLAASEAYDTAPFTSPINPRNSVHPASLAEPAPPRLGGEGCFRAMQERRRPRAGGGWCEQSGA